MKLLASKLLVKTGPVDHADWNYRLLLGAVQRTRFRLIDKLLADEGVDRILEVGYGSGVLMPHLKTFCRELQGIDIHPHPVEVQQALLRQGVEVKLATGSVVEMPYESGYFDRIVIVSALEYVDDIHSACRELSRVLKPTGAVVLVTPGESWFLDFCLRLLTGERASENYQDRRKRMKPVLLEHFCLQREIIVPPVIRMYSALRLVKLAS
jgi:ubiquinone/menaquinone biosynthesis C-methylase UbiE